MNLITIKTYDQAHLAYLDKAKLEERDIQTHLADELTIQTDWFYNNALGGIKLQVFENDLEEAIETLNLKPIKLAIEHTLENPIFDFTCPKCNSNHLYRHEGYNSFFSISLLFLGFPIRPKSNRFICYYCENIWKRDVL